MQLAAGAGLPPGVVEGLLREHLLRAARSEALWARAKLAFVSGLARRLRARLGAETAAREAAELESVCVEVHYLHEAVLERRAARAAFGAMFGQARAALGGVAGALAEVRRIILAPAAGDLGRLRVTAGAAAAGIAYWLDRFCGRSEAGVQAGALAHELEPWRRLVQGLGTAVPPPATAARELGSAIVAAYAHSLEVEDAREAAVAATGEREDADEPGR